MEISGRICLRVRYPCCGWGLILIRLNDYANLSLKCPACDKNYSVFYLKIPNKELFNLLKEAARI